MNESFDVCIRPSGDSSGASLAYPAPYNDEGGFPVKMWVKYHGADSGSVYELMQEVQWPLVLDIDGIVADIKAII